MPQPKSQAKGTGKRKAASPGNKKAQGPAGAAAARQLNRAELEALREKLRRKFH